MSAHEPTSDPAGEPPTAPKSFDELLEATLENELYIKRFPFMEPWSDRLSAWIPAPEQLAAMAASVYGSTVTRLKQESGAKTAPDLRQASKEAVLAALAIVEAIREGASVEGFLDRVLAETHRREVALQQKKETKLRETLWSRLEAAHRKKFALSKSQATNLEGIDLMVYLREIFPKLRGGDEARLQRFDDFCATISSPPTRATFHAYFPDGITLRFLSDFHERFVTFCADSGHRRKVEGASKGGKKSATMRKQVRASRGGRK